MLHSDYANIEDMLKRMKMRVNSSSLGAVSSGSEYVVLVDLYVTHRPAFRYWMMQLHDPIESTVQESAPLYNHPKRSRIGMSINH